MVGLGFSGVGVVVTLAMGPLLGSARLAPSIFPRKMGGSWL